MTEHTEDSTLATLDRPDGELEEIVMEDVSSGELVTAEQAEREERRLNLAMNSFFAANPGLGNPILGDFEITEDEDEEDDETVEAIAAPKKSSLLNDGMGSLAPVATPAIVEEAILQEVVEQLLREVKEEEDRVGNAVNWYSSVLPSNMPVENLMDAYRKERNHLTSLLYTDVSLLDNAPAHIRNKVTRRMREVAKGLAKAHITGQLEELVEKVSTLESSLQDAEMLLSQLQKHLNEKEATACL